MAGDDFYIGYRKTAPSALARFIRAAAFVIVFVVVLSAGVIGAVQEPVGNGTYDFGASDWFMAQVPAEPSAPALVRSNRQSEYAPALLVGQGKHGPSEIVAAMKEQIIQFKGARIARGTVQAIEIGSDKSIEVIGAATNPASAKPINANATLEGELIDTKCYLGVMKPGNGKVHRGCASVCLRGGVPPGLAVRDAAGETHVVALNMHSPDAPALNPEWAGRIVRVTGALEDFMGLPVLNVREMSLR